MATAAAISGKVRIAIDIGGTFTDLQILDEAGGRSYPFKIPTTPDDPSRGLIDGIHRAAARYGFRIEGISGLMHGSTVATNAVLEGKLPRGALVTTLGFEDVLEIGRHVRKDLYGPKSDRAPALIGRADRHGVRERISARGEVVEPLDEAAVRAVARSIATAEVAAVAVCLLHAYANPAHERRLGEILQAALPGVRISLSSDISPEIREFERSSTCVLNALLMPVVSRYLEQLTRRLAAEGIVAPLYLVQSNGGITTPEIAVDQPARLLLSGPSGGARAAETLGGWLGQPNLVAIDMGGTSFDVSVVHAGQARRVTQGQIDGHPVRLPMVEMRTIGAGGGSIAWIDAAGRLRVGPKSAGAEPGPVAYGRGGTEPTVTDANLVLGRIDPDYFLAGAMRLDGAGAGAAIASQVATPLGLEPAPAAAGILTVAIANMAAAIRLSLFEKGLDPEDFALIAFGGAGGLHAAEVARELGVNQVIYPADPGTLSAWGMLFADVAHDLARSKIMPATPASLPALKAMAQALTADGEALLARGGVAPKARATRLSADMRYRGQAYEIEVPMDGIEPNQATLDAAIRDFHELHQAQFAHADAQAIPELVTLRLGAVGRLTKPAAPPSAGRRRRATTGRRRVFLDDAWVDTPVYRRRHLAPGLAVVGPAVIEEEFATVFLPTEWTLEATVDGAMIARHTAADG